MAKLLVQLGIGDVVFAINGGIVPLMGEERYNLLLKAYNKEDLGEYTLYGLQPFRAEIDWDDVDWRTSRFEN